MRKYKMSGEEYNQIIEQAREAKAILESKGFSFVREYLDNALTSIEEAILNGSVKDVKESLTIGQSVKEFFTPKKDQIENLIGQRQFIKKFLADLQGFADMKKDLEKGIEAKKIIVEGVENE
jgi:hypothetical protein